MRTPPVIPIAFLPRSHRHWALIRIFCACLASGFAAHLSASEPAISPPAAAVPAPPAVRHDRPFTEADLLQLLTTTLQHDYVKDHGELELRLSQPWTTRAVPDEPLTIHILDMPTMGVTPMFVARFELRAASKVVGSWQIPLQAKVWREVWVAHSALKRHESLAQADLTRERRDVLTLHEPIAEFQADDASLEIDEPLQSGALLLARYVKPRPVMHRGQAADALIKDGSLSIVMKVEVLEDGVPGQIIRVRNSQSRRDIRGKVLDEQTILVSL